MRMQKGGVLLSTLTLDPASRVPLYHQLEGAIRRLVLTGDLPASRRMPATRQLSRDLGVSRLTVKNAYEQLIAEGFLVSRHGAGTFVARISAIELPPVLPSDSTRIARNAQRLSSRVTRVERSKAITRLGGVRAFRPGVPALDRFPRRAWAATHSRVMRQMGDDLLGYGPPGGLPELKQAIAAHVRDHRGIQCNPEQIIITAGAQQAFSLIALTVLEPGAIVWCEDPGNIAGRDAMRQMGADVRSVPVDEEGFDLSQARANHADSALIFVTPSHQHPLGMTMSLSRRLELLDYAQQAKAWIIEDDYDSEFRYTDRALPALQALDQTGHVLYVGSFSKSLFPALRLGYLICPPSLIDAFVTGQILLSQNVSPVQQQVLATFMLDGSFNAHIRKMRSAYQQRRDLLVESLTDCADDLFELGPCHAGMHLIGWLYDRSITDEEVAKAIWASGIDCLPVSIYCDQQVLRPGIMFGFACAAESEIAGKAATVAKTVRSLSLQAIGGNEVT